MSLSDAQQNLFDDQHESDLAFEMSCWDKGIKHVAGTDEAGRGCLAGPVVAAAVILRPGVRIEGETDSKALSASARARYAEQIRQQALAWCVAECSPEEIDRMNILWAAMEAMRRGVRNTIQTIAEDICTDPRIAALLPDLPEAELREMLFVVAQNVLFQAVDYIEHPTTRTQIYQRTLRIVDVFFAGAHTIRALQLENSSH